MELKSCHYFTDVTTIKKYGDKMLQVKTMNIQRHKFDDDEIPVWYEERGTPKVKSVLATWEEMSDEERAEFEKSLARWVGENYVPKGSVNDRKISESLIRSKRMIFEYAYCNPWECFCTFTVDGSKYDRYQLDAYHKSFAQWIRDLNKRKGLSIKYLLIPEQHKDGAWHEHGFLMGIPSEYLRKFTLKEKLPYYIRFKLKQGDLVYDFPAYREKFGFCDLEPVRNHEAVAKYITKYVTKDLTQSVKDLNAHVYYCSQGLKKAEKIAVGRYNGIPLYDFANIYCKCGNFAYSEEFEELLKGKIQPLERKKDEEDEGSRSNKIICRGAEVQRKLKRDNKRLRYKAPYFLGLLRQGYRYRRFKRHDF